jgi:hypothetical protein
VNRKLLGPTAPTFDVTGTLYVLRDNLAKADAFITAAEELIERSDDGGEDNEGRRRNHVAHLVESAKLAVREAIRAGGQLDERRVQA